MSARFNTSNRNPARWFWLCCLGFSGLASLTMQGRPIEFSEPSSSALATDVSGLGTRPADLPNAEDQIFRPHSYKRIAREELTLRPSMALRRVNVNPPSARGSLDQKKDWTQMTPDEMIQSLKERETLKLPNLGVGDKSAADKLDPYNLFNSRPGGATKNDPRNNARATNRLDSATAGNAYDPFAAANRSGTPDKSPTATTTVGRPADWSEFAHGNDELPLAAGRERKALADRAEESRGTLNFQMPAPNSPASGSAAQPFRPNDFVARAAQEAAVRAGKVNPLLNTPAAPLAPTAPSAPGQTSLTPAPYAPASKAKPVKLNAPPRLF